MKLSAAPLPHPLSHPSLAEPQWARSAVTALLGSRWPAGDESATWDVADRWYALADALSGPRVTAFAAAEQIIAGLSGAGIAPDGFREAWQRLSGDDAAPLNALVQIAAELGQLVEECGREIEAAKLAAWLEVGTLLTELAGLSVAVELTLGAAAPAVDGLITASRVAVELILERLVERVGGEVRNVAAPAPAEPVSDDQHTNRRTLREKALVPTDRGAPATGVGLATRRLASPPRTNEREAAPPRNLGEATRRLDPSGRPTIPFRPSAGSHDRTDEYADFLSTVADRIRANAAPTPLEAAGDRAVRAYAEQLEGEAALVRSRPRPHPPEPVPRWARADRPRAAEVHSPGGLRPAHDVPLKALAEAVPRVGDGRPERLADPRVGRWFALLNAGGPSSDPTRGLNCLDAVLALFETYQHGRPRAAAARVFDGYAHGEPDRPVGGEWSGVRRIQRATGSEFQNLCPFVGGAEPGTARAAVDAALRNLTNHLHNSGHGAFAFILTDFEAGGCHAWAAVNQGGIILFLDPQVARISTEEPLYRHRDDPDANVVSMDALVIDGQGSPAPLPYHGAGQWTAQALAEGP